MNRPPGDVDSYGAAIFGAGRVAAERQEANCTAARTGIAADRLGEYSKSGVGMREDRAIVGNADGAAIRRGGALAPNANDVEAVGGTRCTACCPNALRPDACGTDTECFDIEHIVDGRRLRRATIAAITAHANGKKGCAAAAIAASSTLAESKDAVIVVACCGDQAGSSGNY